MRVVTSGLLMALLVTCLSCSQGVPEAEDAREFARKKLDGYFRLREITKKNAISGSENGTPTYTMLLQADIECVQDCNWNTGVGDSFPFKGLMFMPGSGDVRFCLNFKSSTRYSVPATVKFIKTENGWSPVTIESDPLRPR